MFNTLDGKIQIITAEVKKVNYKDNNPNLLYSIEVKMQDGGPSTPEYSITAKPLNPGDLHIPIKGEIVLLIKATSSYASGLSNSVDVYYISIVGLQNSVQHNALPQVTSLSATTGKTTGDSSKYTEASLGNAQTPSNSKAPAIDEGFPEKDYNRPLQPYLGDRIIQSRYGSSIRFSSTLKNPNSYTLTPFWTTGEQGDPILVISNTRKKSSGNSFVSEDLDNDDTIVVATSGQELKFKPSSSVTSATASKGIDSWNKNRFGKSPTLLFKSGRIVLNSAQAEIIAFSKGGITLSSEKAVVVESKDVVCVDSKKIELGLNSDEPLLLGNLWKSWMESLIDTIGSITVITPQGPSAPLKSTPQWPAIEVQKARINTLLSQLSFTKKT